MKEFLAKQASDPSSPPTYFEGDIRKINPKAFGFFHCKIVAPEGLKHPILQHHVKTKDGIRTVAPLGNWEGMYFSEELYNAEKFGYKYEVKRAYLFEKGDIFSRYINDLYKIRLSYPKSDPMNLIAKLFLNSLYGRFGMDDSFTYTQIISKKDYINFEKQEGAVESIQELIELGDNYLLQIKNPKVELETRLDNGSETHNVNIAIAAAVTAYARIHMSQFKNNPDLPNLYYTDTDSLYFDGPLPEEFVSATKLGGLKLEGIFDEALFLASKFYALKNQDVEIVKIKGVTSKAIKSNSVGLEMFKGLLFKDFGVEIRQNKWFKSLINADITIKDQIYTLKVTNNKRDLIYDYNNKIN